MTQQKMDLYVELSDGGQAEKQKAFLRCCCCLSCLLACECFTFTRGKEGRNREVHEATGAEGRANVFSRGCSGCYTKISFWLALCDACADDAAVDPPSTWRRPVLGLLPVLTEGEGERERGGRECV